MSEDFQHVNPQHHVSHRLTRDRLVLEARRSVVPLVIIAIGAAAGIGGFSYIMSKIGAGPGAKTTLRFAAADATGVVPSRAEVRFKGIYAGKVNDVKLQDGHAVLVTTVQKRFGPVYRDARAVIRPNTPLQDMYLDIVDRGTPGSGLLGHAVLKASRTDTSTNVSDVLQTFEPDVRGRLRTVLSELGDGLRGRQLREAFVELAPFVDRLGILSKQLATRGARTRRLVHNLGRLSSVLAERDATVRRLVADSSRVLTVTADERRGLDGVIRELPPTIQELDASLGRVGEALPVLDQAVRDLGPVAGSLPSGLRSVRRLAGQLNRAATALRTPVVQALPLSRALRSFSTRLSGSVSALRPQTSDIASITKDVAGCPHAAYMFFQWTASITKFDDAMGAYPTGDFGFGADTLSGSNSPGRVASPSCAPGGPKGSRP